MIRENSVFQVEKIVRGEIKNINQYLIRAHCGGRLLKTSTFIEKSKLKIKETRWKIAGLRQRKLNKFLSIDFGIPDKFDSIMEKYIKMSSSLLMITIKEKLYRLSDFYAMLYI